MGLQNGLAVLHDPLGVGEDRGVEAVVGEAVILSIPEQVLRMKENHVAYNGNHKPYTASCGGTYGGQTGEHLPDIKVYKYELDEDGFLKEDEPWPAVPGPARSSALQNLQARQ